MRSSAQYSQTAEVKNNAWPCVLLLVFWCGLSLVGCVEEAFLSTHWSRCKSRIVEAQGLTTRHIEELNGKKGFEWIHTILWSKNMFCVINLAIPERARMAGLWQGCFLVSSHCCPCKHSSFHLQVTDLLSLSSSFSWWTVVESWICSCRC